jgi:hypothetical protein
MDSRLTTLATAKFAVLELATVAGKQAGRSHAQAAQQQAQQQAKTKKQKAQTAPQHQQQQQQQRAQKHQQQPQCNSQEQQEQQRPEGKAEEIEAFILQTLARDGVIVDTWELTANGYDHQEVVGIMKSLLADGYVAADPLEHQFLTLTDEGKDVMLNGSVELRVFNAVPEGGISVAELQLVVGAEVAKLGMGPCMKNKWLKKQGDTLIRAIPAVEDTTAQLLTRLHDALGDMGAISDEDQKNLKRRKLITQVVRKSFRINQGPEFAPVRQKKASDLTKQMLESGEWQTVPFKNYTFNAMGAPVMGGNFHPLLKVRAEIRRTLMNMGFEEMPTNKWVESSFWNFDALFQPQSHPARYALIVARQICRPLIAECVCSGCLFALFAEMRTTPSSSRSRCTATQCLRITMTSSRRRTRAVASDRSATATISSGRRRPRTYFARTPPLCRPRCCTSSPTKKAASSRSDTSRSTACSATKQWYVQHLVRSDRRALT